PTFQYRNGMPYGGLWSHRRDMTISVSSDDGKTWPVSRQIHKGPAAYSDLAVLPDGTILCLYEGGREFRYETVTLARFNLAWLESDADPNDILQPHSD
ncbi:MAG: sialidase family protein, partial [Planctomycetaceae bacterium]